ncbi:peptide deformylase [Ochrobactrum phage vB_OspM_OC]|nr:peptide deformylase [Ochrobactrum phage vB_OspM_OC]
MTEIVNYMDLKPANVYVYMDKDDIDDLCTKLVEALIDTKSIGLSANMIGINKRAIIVGNWQDPKSYLPMFNPRIVSRSQDIVEVDDVCPLFGNKPIPVKRAKEIRVRFTLPTGETMTNVFGGTTAAVIQRAIEALDGETIKSKVNRYSFEQAMKKGVDIVKADS